MKSSSRIRNARERGSPQRQAACAAARAAFLDLTRLAERHTSASTFQLEEDALAEPSALLDPVHEVGDFGWPSRSADDSEKA